MNDGGKGSDRRPGDGYQLGWDRVFSRGDRAVKTYAGGKPNYVTEPEQPPQRKPLTDGQIIEWVESGEYNVITNDWASHIAFARVIESAHGIKE